MTWAGRKRRRPRAGEERKTDEERGRKEREGERKRSGRREGEGSELSPAAGVMAGRRGAEEAIGQRSGQIILCYALYTLPCYFFLIKTNIYVFVPVVYNSPPKSEKKTDESFYSWSFFKKLNNLSDLLNWIKIDQF